jgi:hypothetical protein
MEITNGEINVDLPESLAKLLLAGKSWSEGSTEDHGDRVESRGEDDDPIPMSHIPGVVPGVSMARIKKMVANREVDVYVEGRIKRVKPSEVREVFRKEESNG